MKKTASILFSILLVLAMAAPASAGRLPQGADPAQRPFALPGECACLDAIRLPIHALILTMLENDLPYNAEDDEFVWLALYYTLSMYGPLDTRARYTDEALLLPEECAQDFFHALFSARAELPDPPAALADRIARLQGAGEYRLALGDFGLDYIVLDRPQAAPRHASSLRGGLFSPEDDSLLCSFAVSLERSEGMFGYCVSGAVIE